MTTIVTELNLKPQAKTVLAHLRGDGQRRPPKHITPMEAMTVYGISRLAACIRELRVAGYSIHTMLRHDEAGKGYARYTMRTAVQ